MKKKIMIGILSFVILLTSGCGNSAYIKDKNNEKEFVKQESTGQLIRKDILCVPDDETELYNLYKEYGKELNNKFSDLPKCSEFKINSNESKGLWEFLFVKPLAYLILKLGKLVNNLGISLILIGLAIRLILLPFTIKSNNQTQNMKKAQPELAKIEKKYQNKTDNESLMAKSQETMLVYQKYKVNPMLGCLLAFLQLPLFFAFLQAIYRIPSIYEETLFGLNLGMSPSIGLSQGNYWYLLIIFLIGVSTYFSFKQTMTQTPGNEEAQKQMKIMVYVMLFVIVYASLSLPIALAFYWIITYAFIAIQNIIMNYINNRSFGLNNKNKKNKRTKISEKIAKKESMKYGKNN